MLLLEKMAPIDSMDAELPQTLQFVKKKKRSNIWVAQ